MTNVKSTILLTQGDALHLPLRCQSVHTVCTSPPYFGLRKYQGVPSTWWPEGSYSPVPGTEPMAMPAWYGTLGNEPMPAMYVWHCLLWLRECWRVMRDDAVLWLVCGDAYSNGLPGYPAGCLIGIPQQIMLAASADTIKEDDPDDEYFAFPGGKIGAAWLAALIDGEGTIGITESKNDQNWNSNYTAYLSIGMTDLNVLEHIIKVVGYGRIHVKAQPGTTDSRGIVNRRRYYNYRVEGQKAASIIRYMYPYLIAKKKQAIIAHNLAILLRASRFDRIRHKVPQEIMEKRAWCFYAIKRLNQRHTLDMPNWLLDMPCVVEKPRWVVRNDVTWSKNSPMPESIRGWRWQQARCTCALPHYDTPVEQRPAVGGDSRNGSNVGERTWHNAPDPDCPTCGGTGRLDEEVLRKGSWRHTRATETILQLTKGMNYWSNGEAVREEAVMKPQRRTNGHSLCTYDPPGRQAPSRGDRGVKDQPGIDGPGGRNPRNVVTPAPSNLGLEHYAAFPAGLLLPLIKATCPERCCPTCGMGWSPVISRGEPVPRLDNPNAVLPYTGDSGHTNGTGGSTLHMQRQTTVHGLSPSCPHYCTCGPLAPATGLLVHDRTCPHCGKLLRSVWVPGVLLDPFLGSGTTALVGRALGRTSVGLEASPTYVELARERLGLTALARWQGIPTPPPAEQHYEDLPLFAPQEER